MTDLSNRPADVVTPISDSILAHRISLVDARTAGRRGYEKPTPANSILLLVDHQMGLMLEMRDTASLGELVANI